MSYKALYRTYRPQSFNEVIGQKTIVQTLMNALNENKISHAYLFAGPRGTGKTTMARLLAKSLNCSEGFGHQCNKCENCLSIAQGNHPDVIEIDAASNRGIDDIRDLIENVKYSPIMGRYKVYIIDEVHMLTNEAFNALLKTLEEPPSNVIFILATTEPHKLMPTIMSRLQRYDFEKVSDKEIISRVKEILKKENVTYEDQAIEELVSLADGGVRDTLSMLDQAIVYSQNNITLLSIQDLFSLTSKSEKIKILLSLQNKDIASLNSLLDNFASRGVNIKKLNEDLLTIFKDILISKVSSDTSLLKVLDQEDLNKLNFSVKEVQKDIDILLTLSSQLRLLDNPRSLLEIALLKMLPSEEKVVKEEIKVEVKQKVEGKKVVEETKPAETPKSMNIKPLVTKGNIIEFNEDDIINIMVQASKSFKDEIKVKTSNLQDLLPIENLGMYISTLKMAVPSICSPKFIVYVSKLDSIVSKINLKENQEGFKYILKAKIGKSPSLICLKESDYIDYVNHYKSLYSIRKLPEPKEINIDCDLNIVTPTEALFNELEKGE